MRRRGPRRRNQEDLRHKVKLAGGFLLAFLIVASATSWWGSLPAPDEPEEISCPDIEEVIGETIWDDYKACQEQYIRLV